MMTSPHQGRRICVISISPEAIGTAPELKSFHFQHVYVGHMPHIWNLALPVTYPERKQIQ